jgi:sugar/nucleoside kinase (ribokinase family)
VSPRFDVVGLGVAALDYVTRLEAWPAPDTKIKTDTLVVGGGGTVGTALVTVARQGLKAAFAGSLGDDGAGRQVLAEFEREKVDTSLASVVTGARTTWAFCVAHGQVRNVFSIRSTAPPLSPDDRAMEAMLSCRALHLDGSEEQASCELAREARRRGILCSLDAGSVRASSRELLEQIGLLVMSEHFLREYVGAEAGAAALVGLHTPDRLLTAVTRGARGTLAYDGREIFEVPAEPVEVADSTGAGDVFHGALLAALLRGLELRRALGFASHLAARSCRALGGRQSIPRRADVTGWFDD